MKFISLDQKPSWFNNSGHTLTYGRRGEKAPSVSENFAKMRERYTIFTVVESWCRYGVDADALPPHVFVLFKGKKGGRILNDLRAVTDLPAFLHLQIQELGSYREEDVIDALRKVLPIAATTEESMVVLLDWFAAHRCETVIAFIEGRGHIVLFHGGGCTPFTQVNDTHLHASLQRLLVKLENKVMHGKRVDMHLNWKRGIPTMSRADVCDVVVTAWKTLPHAAIARTGYMQTGPGLPGSGPIRHEQVYKDLRTVWNEIDPPIGLQEMGQKIRDDAYAFVSAGFPEKWSTWHHAKRLITEMDTDPDEHPMVEGMEAFGYDFRDDGDDDDDDNDAGDDQGDGFSPDGDQDHDGKPPGALVAEPVAAPEEANGTDGSELATGSADPATVSVAQAREVLIQDARRRRDDVSLRRLLSQRAEANNHKSAAATEIAHVLQRRALQEHAENKVKREKAMEAERAARTDEELAKARRAEAEARNAELKLQLLREHERQHKAEQKRRHEEAKFKAQQKWLQTEYPRDLAKLLSRATRKQSESDKAAFIAKLEELRAKNWFRMFPRLPAFWEVDKSHLIRYGDIKPLDGGPPRSVRCSPNFDSYLIEAASPGWGVRDPCSALKTLLNQAAPHCVGHVFSGDRNVERLLHMNEYCLDKAFVCGVYCLSKWLGATRFPHGIFDWPPRVPDSALPAQLPIESSPPGVSGAVS